MDRGTLLVISGPSGAGKGTLCAALLKENRNLQFSVSATTRKPRPGEIDGVHYDFVTEERFDRMIANGDFLEYACVFGKNRYGTPKERVQTLLQQGVDVLLDIDVQGAMNVKKSLPDAVTVFVLPPSYAILRQRLILRGTEDESTLRQRLKTALDEIKLAPLYDYFIVNDDLDTAIAQLKAILLAESCRTARNGAAILNNWEEQR
jgi:guanylate kinase